MQQPKLTALILNCTLKKSPESSNTEALAENVIEILGDLNCRCELVRAVDYHIPFGVSSDEG